MLVSYGGVFVTFEGLDGSGKTTQARLLAEQLQREGRDVVMTREPGGTALGERVRELLLRGGEMSPWAEAALFAAARAELVERVIRPALERGADVICDRFLDSSLAYQGIARGLGVEAVLELNIAVTGGLLPDRTFVLLVDLEMAAQRLGRNPDRIEQAGAVFRRRVDAAYRELAQRFPDRIVAVDGGRPVEAIADEIRRHVLGGAGQSSRGIEIRPLAASDRDWVRGRLEEWWSATRVVSRGRVHDADSLPGFVAVCEGQPVGLVTYSVDGADCEIVTLNSLVHGRGIGSRLIDAVRDEARSRGCSRIWLITTNDNTKALRFYQRRGFSLRALHQGAIEESRRLKPEISATGADGIPIRDELELELRV